MTRLVLLLVAWRLIRRLTAIAVIVAIGMLVVGRGPLAIHTHRDAVSPVGHHVGPTGHDLHHRRRKPLKR